MHVERQRVDETWVTDGAQVGAGGLRAATALGTRSRVCLCGARGASGSPCGARSSLFPTRAQCVGAPSPGPSAALRASHPPWVGLRGCAFGRAGLRRASPRGAWLSGTGWGPGASPASPPGPGRPTPWAPALGLLLAPHFVSDRSAAAGRDPRLAAGERVAAPHTPGRAPRGLRQDVVSPFLQRGFSELAAQSARYDSRRGPRWFYLGRTLEDRTLRRRSHRTRPRAVRAQETLVAPFSATPRPSENLVFRVGSYTWRLEWGHGGRFLGRPSSHGPRACA